MSADEEIAEALANGEEVIPLNMEPTLVELLDIGVQRLKERPTWKVCCACRDARSPPIRPPCYARSTCLRVRACTVLCYGLVFSIFHTRTVALSFKSVLFPERLLDSTSSHHPQVWQWQNEDGTTKEYYDAESFRAAVEEEQLDSDLRALLPRPDGKPIEKPAEAALRQRM